MDYQEYLQTPEWRERARQEKEEAGNKCQVCGGLTSDLEVHHNSYANIDYENPGTEPKEDLIVLCARCHGLFEERRRGFPNPSIEDHFEAEEDYFKSDAGIQTEYPITIDPNLERRFKDEGRLFTVGSVRRIVELILPAFIGKVCYVPERERWFLYKKNI